jgi:uncharacterized secreted repeat protein (TIGR03808 family)
MIDRRRLFAAALALPTACRLRVASAQIGEDAAPRLQRAIDLAQRGDGIVTIPMGTSHVSRLRITGDVRLIGAGRASRLASIGAAPLLTIDRAASVSIENVAFDGANLAPGGEAGLIEARDVGDLSLVDCLLERAAGYGLKAERCGGRIARSSFHPIAKSAIHSLDATGLSIIDNRIEDCGVNGLEVFRSAIGYDGTILRDNRLTRIRADPGRDGPYGNAIAIFRAGGVSCIGNVIRQAAFSAIRFNSGADALISGNSCADIGETAIYVEFAFQGAVVSSNVVDGASTGISVTNFDQGGRLAAVTGNVLRNCVRQQPQGGANFGVGIHVEADTAASGNVVDNARFAGIEVGYGNGLHNVVAADNVVNDSGFGIAVSVAPGAGGATIRDNRLRARDGALVGMAWEKVVSADLVKDAAKYPQLAISGNEAG